MSTSSSPSGIRHSSLELRHSPLVSVCSEIGRGHPAYLDSVLLALERLCTGHARTGLGHDPKSRADFDHVPRFAVPELCTGTSGLAWGLARLGYRFGALGGFLTWTFNRLRSADARPSRLQLSLLGSSLRRRFTEYEGIAIVDHPLLAHILAPVCRVAYLHCEIAAPGLSAVPGAWRTFVPVESTARQLEAFGVSRERLSVTGLVVEPELVDVAESAFPARITRLASDRPLTIGFFASGARPRPHVSRIVTAAFSVARAGHKAVLFWGTGMLRAARAQLALRRQGAPEESTQVIWTRDRRHETARTAEFFPNLDVLVAAAHERTNWAVGLGLPMFALMPNIGPFAAGNCAFASEQGTCLPLEGLAGAAGLADTIADLRRSGRLAEMARNGWGRHTIAGAQTTARELLSAA